jgi:hypothetical protein
MSQLLCSQEMSETIITRSDSLLLASEEVKGSGRLKFILRTFLDLNNSLLKGNKARSVSYNLGFLRNSPTDISFFGIVQ